MQVRERESERKKNIERNKKGTGGEGGGGEGPMRDFSA